MVRTVLGDVPAAELGPCDAHEHLFLRSPLLPGEELADRDLAAAEASFLAAAGAASVVDWTPIGLGRDPLGLVEVARRSGLHVVAATGFHRQAHYPRGHWAWREPIEELRALVVADLADGIDANDCCGPRERRTEVRAGVVKVGAGYWHASPLERKLIEAAASAAVAAGVPVCAHSEHGTFALELVDLLLGHGVAADAIVVAHLDRNPDAVLHRAVAETGVFLQYDGPGRAKYHPDATILSLIEAVASAGHGDQLLLGGDTPRRSHLVSAGGGPGMAYPFATFLPRLRRELGDVLADRITVANPARAFALRAAA
jgi:predicted metal-dependent phosphotriesterase family hydrolase